MKQRLVGVAVLVSIAVIFMPLVLQSPDEVNPGFENEVIPPKSSGLSVKVLPLNIPERVEPVKPDPAPAAAAETAASDAAPVPPVADAVATEPESVARTAPKPPVAQAENVPKTPGPSPAAKPVAGAPGAWVVQLGSFSGRDNAFALRDKLRKRRYAAFVDDVAGGPGNKRIYRVRVGPELLRSRADTLRNQLEKDFRLKGIVVAHEVR